MFKDFEAPGIASLVIVFIPTMENVKRSFTLVEFVLSSSDASKEI